MHSTVSACARSRAPRADAAILLALSLAGASGAAAPLPALAQAGEGGAASAQADEQQQYDIEGGPLDAVLNRFALAAGTELSVSSDLTRGKSSPGLKGRYTVEQALRALLAGSGLSYRFAGENRVTLVAAQEGDGPMRLDPIRVGGESGETAYGPVEGYRATRSATATRTDTPIAATPVSIQVVPREVIRDQAAFDAAEVFRNVSGTRPGFTQADVSERVSAIVRGFEPQIYYNGFPTRGVSILDLANVERLEVLKGPASMVFGQVEPGGLVNIVPEAPRSEPFVEIAQRIGSYEHYRTDIDVGAPLDENGTLLGRLNVSYTDSDSFRDFVDLERILLAPSLTWRPNDRTEVRVDVSHAREEQPWDDGVSFTADGEPPSDVDIFLNEPGLDGIEAETTFASLRATHDLTDWLTLRGVFQFNDDEFEFEAVRKRAFAPIVDNKVQRFFDDGKTTNRGYQFIGDVRADFDLWDMEHSLLVGVDLRTDEQTFDARRDFQTDLSVDIENPQRGLPPLSLDTIQSTTTDTDWAGVYIQNQVALLPDDRLKLLLGGRYDSVTIDRGGDFGEGKATEEAFTGRVGALYQLTDWMSPFASFSQSFLPVSPTTTGPGGGTLDPEEGEQYEVGVKFSHLGGRLSSTLAVYRINKDNVPISLESGAGLVNGGEQRSQGIEYDLSGEILPGWQIIASYAYTDTEVLESDFLPEGGRFRNVPDHSGSLWSTYAFQPGSRLEGFGFGGGVFGASDREGAQDNSFELDSYAVVDAMAWYETSLAGGATLRLQFNVENLFDKEYFPSALAKGSVFPGEPRTFTGTATLRW